MKAHYRATIEYDGTDYYGFQRQIAEQITIQSELERVISALAQCETPIRGAGRTDRGVHARGQVIGFDLAWRHTPEDLQRAMNANLPADIAVRDVGLASADFHPRFSAKQRAYRYTILNTAQRQPLLRRSSWQIREPLDIGLMNAAAELLIGKHDFATFGTPPFGNNTVRDIFVAIWQQKGTTLFFDVVATAFLKRMVRSIVGCLKAVGDKTWSVDEFKAAFEAADRSRCIIVAPPQGLVLESVKYD